MLRETKTENGRVRGVVATDARITVYKGIPFAADTSGENRWRPPQPAKDWEGVRDCSEFGPIPMQRIPGRDPEAFYSKEWHVDPAVPMGEDCLRANIWTPARSTDEKLPVMVWIFGGGLQEGYPHEMEFDGERIASRGVILVSIGYRVNVFGLLCHPEITAENPEAPANFAFQDQAYGIAWVKRNIANFGGDPNNITIFGQSAGGMSILAQMASPKTKGLFQKGIIESIGGMNPVVPTCMGMPQDPLDLQEKRGIEFFEQLGVKSLAEARALDAQYILDKFYEGFRFWGAVIDGKFLPKSIDETIVANELHDVPFMIGNTKDEFLIPIDGEDDAAVDAWIDRSFGDKAEEYRAIVKAMPGDYRTNATVHQMWLGNLMMDELAAKQGRKFYSYVFGPTIPGDDAGSFHSCDLWFQFETLMKCWRPFDGHHFDLSRKICNYWTNFAKNGDPNGLDKDGTPMPEWTPYTTESPYSIHLYDEIAMEEGSMPAKDRFLVDLNLKKYL
ncbi:MAG: carboxylesterase family protein [Oscillospiraceae bacterium]|nr:carboxylesterase family protein [Oscillospiraceae bacterium]